MDRNVLLSQHKETGVEIERRLREKFSPTALEIKNDSSSHVGHRGNAVNGGHYFLEITAEVFRDKSLLERQRMVFAEVSDLMEERVHALSMKCRMPGE